MVMNLAVGIVGLANAGKSTLFNALLKKQQALVANYPFATIEPNVGIVPVPDDRLEKLVEVVKTQKIVPATVEFIDIAGLIAGAHKGEGLGNKFLAHIREVQVICHVVRAFGDNVDVKGDYETVKTELELADLEHPEAPPLAKKPEIVVINVAEKDLGSKVYDLGIVICAKTEAELGEEDAKEYLRELGIRESGLNQVIREAYKKLDLMSFLTGGEKEVRAWTLRRGDTALRASSVIHTDFAKKFIKADVVKYEDFIRVGGWKNAREAGLVRSEGRDYIMQEEDVVEFKIGM
jgi:ribosome-binding ATPase